MIIVWSSEALLALDEILTSLDHRSPAAARKLQTRILDATARLSLFPQSGRPVQDALGDREIIVGAFVIQYRIDTERLLVLSMRHGSRDEESPEQVHEQPAHYGSDPEFSHSA